MDREQREIGHEQLEVVLNELHTQSDLLHAQTMANSAMAKFFDKQMLELRMNVRKELTRFYEHYGLLQNETKSCVKQYDEYPQTLANLVTDVEQLKATKVDKCEITNQTDDVNFVEELRSTMESLKENIESITVEMNKRSDQMNVHIEQCSKQCTQGLTELKNDVDQLRIETKKCNEQCTNNDFFCVQAQNLVDQCDKGVALMALQMKEQADILFGTIESFRLENFRPQWAHSGVDELKAKDKPSPARTVSTLMGDLSYQSNSDESWSVYDDEHLLRDDDKSEHDTEGRKQRMAWNRRLASFDTEFIKSLAY